MARAISFSLVNLHSLPVWPKLSAKPLRVSSRMYIHMDSLLVRRSWVLKLLKRRRKCWVPSW